MINLKNIIPNFLILLVSLVLALGVCETILRFYNPLGFRLKGDRIILPVNKTEILHHEPGLAKLDRVVVNRRNSLGFRGEEPPPDFARNLTLVTVGGSTTECFDLAEDKTWPHLLGVKLQRDFSRVWLNNAGLSGNSSFGHYILMQDYLVRLQPKVVIFLVGVNDIGIGAERDFDERLHVFNGRSLERFLASAAVYSEAATAGLNLYRYYFPKSVMITNQGKAQETDLAKLPDFQVSPTGRSAILQEHRDYFLNPYRQRLQKLINICRQHGIQPIFLTQPVLYGSGIDPATGVNLGQKLVATGMDGHTAWEVLELYNDIVRRLGREENFTVIDLARKMPKNSIYFYDLMHYTNTGAALVADLVYQQLRIYLAGEFPSFVQGPGSGPPMARLPQAD